MAMPGIQIPSVLRETGQDLQSSPAMSSLGTSPQSAIYQHYHVPVCHDVTMQKNIAIKVPREKLWPKKGNLTLLKLKEQQARVHSTQFFTTLRPLTSDWGSEKSFTEQNITLEEICLVQRMPEILKHSPENFYKWFWTRNYGQCLTKGNFSVPSTPECTLSMVVFPTGAPSALSTVLGEVWPSQALTLWAKWHLCAHTGRHVLWMPSPVWFPKLFMEETNSGSGYLATLISNIKNFLKYVHKLCPYLWVGR